MPPFLRLVPLPRQLTELPKPLALGVGLAVTIPTTAARIGQQVLVQAVTTGVELLGRGVEIGNAFLGHHGSGYGDDEDEPFPTYTGLDTSAWGAGDDDAEVVQLFEEDAQQDAPVEESAAHEPPITLESGLAAAVEDRAEEPVTAPTRQDLPVEGYDGLSATALRSKVAGLSKGELEAVRDYESGHAKRVTVLSMLERQIAKA